MATNASTNTNTTEEVDTFDRAEVSRLVSMMRHELSTLADDARRKRPLFSKSPKEARGRRDAAVKVLQEFADKLTSMRTG
ncbi:hypothetical protein GWK18_09920 [Kocuria sp. JC486]|uniref:hypothetical protein n=1 Tax=Kocuria sp. JC486 TaxID=1970736 RepID=UPI00141F95D1|nr:hypothetical protein [Kocuria sp. JC486]NHU85895.1 hypothetical protein [Kocuria sp. JC486]